MRVQAVVTRLGMDRPTVAAPAIRSRPWTIGTANQARSSRLWAALSDRAERANRLVAEAWGLQSVWVTA